MTKVRPLRAALADAVSEGTLVHLALGQARPNAAIRELFQLLRSRDLRISLSSPGVGGPQLGLFLVADGRVPRVVCGFIGDQYPSPGPNRTVNRLIDDGRVQIEAWSLLSFLQRLRAAAEGQEWVSTRSLVGSSIPEGNPDVRMADGMTMVRALRPDVTLLHGVVADEDGNTALSSPAGEGIYGAAASRGGAIVTVEKIVSRDEMRALTGITVLPGLFVRSVSVARFGAHPSGVYTVPPLRALAYSDDYEFIEETVRALRTSEDEREGWVRDWLLTGHDEYLDRLGGDRLQRLVRGPEPATSGEHPGAATPEERMIVLGARVVESTVAGDRPSHVLAGIGVSSLSAWLAQARNEQFPALISELGFYDYHPVPGNPFLFYYPNISTCAALSDTYTILGTLVQGHGASLGVLAGAQVDRFGNVNTTRTASGWLTGSGGANDIATGSARNIVLVPQRPGRLVAAVDYITSPGDNVQTVVTDCAVFEKSGHGELKLSGVLAEAHEYDAIVRSTIDSTPWPVLCAAAVARHDPPAAAELALLRSFDPRRHFLGRERG